MVYTHSSVCLHRSAVTREFTWCIHTHQCVFVEVQRLESSHGVYILISVHRSAAAREFTWCIYTHQCVFVEVQWLESSHDVYTLISVCL